jgi:hypothetical protein
LPYPQDQHDFDKVAIESHTLITGEAISKDVASQPDKFLHYWGFNHNFAKSKAIFFAGEKIRVFAEEFSVLNDENLSLYIMGNEEADPSHEAMEDATLSAELIPLKLTAVQKEIFDAALCDGASDSQAKMVAHGIDIFSDTLWLPLSHWYKLRKDYAELLGSD